MLPKIVSINLVGGETGSRGFCFVDFATRDDLAKALERNDALLCGRPLSVRIADPNTTHYSVDLMCTYDDCRGQCLHGRIRLSYTETCGNVQRHQQHKPCLCFVKDKELIRNCDRQYALSINRKVEDATKLPTTL
ncbi:hypothetical protein CSKR_103071 [Clonorchis sinensis]|uniref:RRM domain-containing protein n=1 Tax=Clonorchis sinensis TaxID=79923 RepID=A0A8T1ML91_CLOSI|nr:hypothetical protein CSKR_103071 [Clonorchis sinensis]